MFYEIYLNVAMETSEKNCSSAKCDFHPKERRTRSPQKQLVSKVHFPTMLNAQVQASCLGDTEALPGRWEGGGVHPCLNKERTVPQRAGAGGADHSAVTPHSTSGPHT